VKDKEVLAVAKRLEGYLVHCLGGNWDYSRETGIKHIRMEGDWTGYNHPFSRLKRTIELFIGKSGLTHDWGRDHAWKYPRSAIKVWMGTEKHIPDGGMGGTIITHWEEDGEYIQYVQPRVGKLLVDLMKKFPDLPEVQAIASEMIKIENEYSERLDAEKQNKTNMNKKTKHKRRTRKERS